MRLEKWSETVDSGGHCWHLDGASEGRTERRDGGEGMILRKKGEDEESAGAKASYATTIGLLRNCHQGLCFLGGAFIPQVFCQPLILG